MSRKKIVIGTAMALIGLPIASIALLFANFYAVFYFPNWSGAAAYACGFS